MTDWKPEKYGYKFESYEKPYREDTPWPCMRGNIKNSGQLFESHSAHSQGGINETIHFRTGNAIFSTPVIGKDDIIYIGSADHKFYAMDPHKKEILWEDELAEIIDSAACIGKDRTIYIAAADAKIHAYTIEGKKKWVYDVLHDRPKHQFSLSTNFWYEAN